MTLTSEACLLFPLLKTIGGTGLIVGILIVIGYLSSQLGR
jgi:hypothetical protein